MTRLRQLQLCTQLNENDALKALAAEAAAAVDYSKPVLRRYFVIRLSLNCRVSEPHQQHIIGRFEDKSFQSLAQVLTTEPKQPRDKVAAAAVVVAMA